MYALVGMIDYQRILKSLKIEMDDVIEGMINGHQRTILGGQNK